ncbi:MAG: prepilin-type N-terminal cleavage/methylation domain-containing protein [Deferrisomatales bacterium]|nr:prepilin-type N-terminal cleavage/methylation domain-containing protein [Deferrisomatales bacterium]
MAVWIRIRSCRRARARLLRGGFSFLELLLALAILGSAFTVLLSAHTSAARQEAQARRLMTATLLTRELLTETEVEGFPDLGQDDGDFGEAFPDYAWERRVETTEFEGVRLVRLIVFWPERGDRASTELVYYAVEGER